MEKTPVGTVINGEIKNITEFALFVSIGSADLTGMIHYKDISWQETDEVLKKFKREIKLKQK